MEPRSDILHVNVSKKRILREAVSKANVPGKRRRFRTL